MLSPLTTLVPKHKIHQSVTTKPAVKNHLHLAAASSPLAGLLPPVHGLLQRAREPYPPPQLTSPAGPTRIRPTALRAWACTYYRDNPKHRTNRQKKIHGQGLESHSPHSQHPPLKSLQLLSKQGPRCIVQPPCPLFSIATRGELAAPGRVRTICTFSLRPGEGDDDIPSGLDGRNEALENLLSTGVVHGLRIRQAITSTFSFPVSGGQYGQSLEVELNDAPLVSEDHTSVGLQSWASLTLLAERICANPEKFSLDLTAHGRGLRLLQLDAGTGLLSITVAKILASRQGALPELRRSSSLRTSIPTY